MQERIQKILSKCGIASRRKAEEMMIEGRVTVNGAIATPGMKADFSKDHIKVDGKLIRRTEPKVYLILNKPVKCVTAVTDPEGRITVRDYMKGVKAKVFPVGRLDYHSEGLLIMTNDGELANALLRPKSKVPKTYLVKVNGLPDDKDIDKLQKGIKLEDGITAPAKVRRIRQTNLNSWIEITIYEGRKRQIRRMLERIKHPVMRLRRVRIDGLALGRLQSGSFRYLTPDEVKKLKKTVSH
jgi:23S rRNA pseudouridine2605 synthase